MIQIRELKSTEPLAEMKQAYIRQTTAPLDGMWLCGFVPMSTHFGFYDETKPIGFCCVNDEGYLLQFFLTASHHNQSSQLFESILRSDDLPTPKISGAFVSTAEPHFMSLCLDHFSKWEVNALMYKQETESNDPAQDSPLDLVGIDSTRLPDVVEFAHAAIGAPEEWLTGYFSNLINRQELFGLWDDGCLVATGENRGFDEYQTEYVDLGVIVAESQRCKGLATRILKHFTRMNEDRGLKSICSTEKTNLGAQKAIVRAGFFADNRIVQFKA